MTYSLFQAPQHEAAVHSDAPTFKPLPDSCLNSTIYFCGIAQSLPANDDFGTPPELPADQVLPLDWGVPDGDF